MLAQHPYEINEINEELTREQFKEFVTQLNETMLEDGEVELVRFELTWKNGKMCMKALHKVREEPSVALASQIMW
jgi:hypothetical protein